MVLLNNSTRDILHAHEFSIVPYLRPISLLCLAAMIAISLGAATLDNVTTGPFKISFDMGLPKESYIVTVSPPEESLSGEISTKYEIEIKNKIKDKTGLTRLVSISITDYQEEQRIVTADDMTISFRDTATNETRKVRMGVDTAIDGTTGAMVSMDLPGTKMYSISYNTSFDPHHVSVAIISAFPWEEGTLQLLKTFHIEKT